MAITKVETRKQTGYVQTKTGSIPIELEITDTFHDSGRKDVAIKVPRLRVRPKQKG